MTAKPHNRQNRVPIQRRRPPAFDASTPKIVIFVDEVRHELNDIVLGLRRAEVDTRLIGKAQLLVKLSEMVLRDYGSTDHDQEEENRYSRRQAEHRRYSAKMRREADAAGMTVSAYRKRRARQWRLARDLADAAALAGQEVEPVA